MSKKRKGLHPIVKILITVVVLGVLAFFAYSVWVYESEAAEQHGIVVCNGDGSECKISLHIHADTELSVCGEKLRLPLETGPLDEAHTHKERNYLHFHDALLYDVQKQEILATQKLTLGEFFDNMDVRFTSTCLGDKCNDDLCGTTAGKLTMMVNGVPNQEFREYVWSDGDVITLTFE